MKQFKLCNVFCSLSMCTITKQVQAMKSLLKSGDTDRIIFYANVCRHREIYMMAAHYLQTIDLKTSPQLMDTIVQFYTKAKVPESIISFYESCAQSTAEEVDYVTTLTHLRKAEAKTKDLLQISSNGNNNNNNNNNKPPASAVTTIDARKLQNRLLVVQTKIEYVEKFLKVQRYYIYTIQEFSRIGLVPIFSWFIFMFYVIECLKQRTMKFLNLFNNC